MALAKRRKPKNRGFQELEPSEKHTIADERLRKRQSEVLNG